MRKLILLVMMLGAALTLVPAAFAQDHLFNVSLGTNGGANRFWVTAKCEFYVSGQGVPGRPSFDNVGDWLNYAAGVFDGTTVATGSLSGNGAPNGFALNPKNNSDLWQVRISGSNIGGAYRWDFDNEQEGQNFLDFLLMVRNDDSNLFLRNCGLPIREDFDVSLDTNGGANRFYVEGGQFKVWGQSVSGIFATTDIIAYVNEAARLYDCAPMRTGNYNGGTPNIRRATDSGRVILGGRGVGGRFMWDCGTQPKAANFASFLDLIAHAELFELEL